MLITEIKLSTMFIIIWNLICDISFDLRTIFVVSKRTHLQKVMFDLSTYQDRHLLGHFYCHHVVLSFFYVYCDDKEAVLAFEFLKFFFCDEDKWFEVRKDVTFLWWKIIVIRSRNLFIFLLLFQNLHVYFYICFSIHVDWGIVFI